MVSMVRRTIACGKSPKASARKPRVAIVYHFFAHYRAAVMQILLDCDEIDYLLVGDRTDPDRSIKPWQPPEDRLLSTRCTKISSALLWQRGLIGLAVSRKFDAMIFLGNANFLSTWVAALLARLTLKRVLFWTHGWIKNERGGKAIIRHLFYALAHGLLLYGHRAKQIGVSEGYPADKLYVVYNSLDYEQQRRIRRRISREELQAIRNSLFGESATPLIVCTARLTAACQFPLLLEAMDMLRCEGHIVHALLIGDGPEQTGLESLARAKRLPVRFYGPCYNEAELAGMIMAANVTVSPGKVGLTCMHSLAYGTPVITHDNFDTQGPEFEAILPAKSGDFFRFQDSEDLARVIRQWTGSGDIRSEREREVCYDVIEKRYNPGFQRKVIELALGDKPAGATEVIV
ncbi:MAG: glycosyltransferase [Nitrospira sp. CR1.3]|nr:glycosyltransferase [Nitrospira sp. CR1.3]